MLGIKRNKITKSVEREKKRNCQTVYIKGDGWCINEEKLTHKRYGNQNLYADRA